MPSYNPLRVANRKPQSYSSVTAQDHSDEDVDVEKRTSTDYSDYTASPTSSSSSRTPSNSHQAMLRRSSSSSSVRRKASSFNYRPRRRYSRYFALVLGSTLIILILTLTRLSYASSKSVQQGAPKPPPPPPAWEAFPFLKRYHGGIRTLVSRKGNVPEYPSGGDDIPQISEKSGEGKEEVKPVLRREEGEDGAFPVSGTFDPYDADFLDPDRDTLQMRQECYLHEKTRSRIPMLHVYNGVPLGMPENVMGSYSLLGIRDDVCFERFGRLGPYGLGYSRKLGGTGAGMEGDREGIAEIWTNDTEVDYRRVKWREVQDRCLEKNRFRFKPNAKDRNHFYQTMAIGGPDMEPPFAQSGSSRLAAGSGYRGEETANFTLTPDSKKLLSRTAVLIRTWWDYKYDDEDLMFLRALISELSIASGGEYTVHFLVHVKDDNLPIWADDATYQRVLDESLPFEFRGMGVLWSERQMGLIYGGLAESFYRGLPVHGAYRSTFMPVQYFAHQHPEYDFFWHWEMDARYTGHYYHLFDRVAKWAAAQPRKGLWERNARFYVPARHGSWEDFKQMVRVQTEHGTASKSNIWAGLAASNPNLPGSAQPQRQGVEKPVWGPEHPLDDPIDDPNGMYPLPPTTHAKDNYDWGVAEQADLIVFNPLFDPAGTNWILADDVTGYNTTRGMPPRRTAIVTAGRLSRRLLEAMHAETALRRHAMFSEMWPASVALHHGLKAVYAPHPVFVDRRWPTDYLAAVFNGGRNGASGGARTSVFSDERQHNFRGTTWYYDAGFAPNLWKRWLGYKVDNDGGEQWEVHNEGRMCLPAMLLHPVKQVDLVFEHRADEV